MSHQTNKTLDYYLSLPYTIEPTPDEGLHDEWGES